MESNVNCRYYRIFVVAFPLASVLLSICLLIYGGLVALSRRNFVSTFAYDAVSYSDNSSKSSNNLYDVNLEDNQLFEEKSIPTKRDHQIAMLTLYVETTSSLTR
jgi:hypothetical protein